MSTLGSPSLSPAMRGQGPRRGTGWSSPGSARAGRLHSLILAVAAEKLPVLQMQFRWVGDAVTSQRCGLYSTLGALNIQPLEVKSFFFFKCPMYLVIMFSSSKWITWKLSSTVLSSLILLWKFIETPLKHPTKFFSAWKAESLAKISILLPSTLTCGVLLEPLLRYLL